MTTAVKTVTSLAQRVLDGGLDPLEGCVYIYPILARDLSERVPSDLLDFFSAISSELDSEPVGAVRQHWAQSELAKRDAGLASYRGREEGAIREACLRLIQVFGR